MAKGYAWIVHVVMTTLFYLVQCSREPAHNCKDQCPQNYNQSLPESTYIRATGEYFTNHLNQRDKNYPHRETTLSPMASPKDQNKMPDGFQRMKCLNLKEISKARDLHNLSLAYFQQPLTTLEPVIIHNRTECFQESVRNAYSISELRVIIGCCVSFCHHKIILRAEKGHGVFLKFTDFRGPSLSSSIDLGFKQCHPYIHIETSKGHINVGRFCRVQEPSVQFVQHNEVKLQLSFFDNLVCKDNITFTVTVSPCVGYQVDDWNGMRLNQLSENEGYITSPGFHVDSYYPNVVDCTVKISVPEEKLIKIKSNVFQLKSGDFLALRPIINESFRLFPKNITYSGPMKTLPPLVLPSNESIVQFISNSVESYVGFNLTYIAVDENEFIPMFLNGSLDCSGLATIPEYLKCDIHRSCALGEDERNCTYRNSKCGSDGFFYNNNCYFVIEELHNHSWTDATNICAEKYKAHLISINTVEESKFLERIWELHTLKSIFLGLNRQQHEGEYQMYNRLWRWSDGTTGLYLPNELPTDPWKSCSLYKGNLFNAVYCNKRKKNVSVICEQNNRQYYTVPRQQRINRDLQNKTSIPQNPFPCLSGEYISRDLHCDGVKHCSDGSDERMCTQRELGLNKFQCESEQLVSYSNVCNGENDCSDGSDESRCQRPSFAFVPEGKTMCVGGMLIAENQLCDGRFDCPDRSDENCNDRYEKASFYCFPSYQSKSWFNNIATDSHTQNFRHSLYYEETFKEKLIYSVKPPGVVHPDGYGKILIKPLKENELCPDTHFPCKDGFCIPVYMLCNLFKDCPYGEDEDQYVCDMECRGLYKCKYSSICLHKDRICDGIYNCPFKDDETICSNERYVCPRGCLCNRSEISCTTSPILNETTKFSYINIKTDHLNQTFLNKVHSYSLIYLNISSCSIDVILSEHMHFPNLFVFDASRNKIKYLDENTFEDCQGLEQLFLGKNRLEKLGTFRFLKSTKLLKVLDLSSNQNVELYENCFWETKKLQKLYLRDMGITVINKGTFKGLVSLDTLDLRGNRIALFSKGIFKDQQNLVWLIADNFRLCCPSITPETLENGQCIAPFDEVSSCTDLLRSYYLRISLWVMAALTIVGNIGVITWRIFFDDSQRINFRIIVTNLAGSDLIMGIYLVIIGVGDASTRDEYLVHEEDWKSSIACKIAGYLCLLSTEVSAIFILVATIDRLLVIVFPLRREFHLTGKSATVVSIVVWLVGLTLSTIPLLPPFEHWNLYSQRPMGVPLPITTKDYPGLNYTFGIFIVFNIFVFILVCAGQLVIYLSVTRRHRPQMSECRMKQDTTLAKRLALVVGTDCLCWFPIATMGILAQAGIQIPVDMHVSTTVFVLPVNSALNPFLYTINAVWLKRKRTTNASSNSPGTANLPFNRK